MTTDEYERYLINKLRGEIFDEARADDANDKSKLTYLNGAVDARLDALFNYDPDHCEKLAHLVLRFLHGANAVSIDRKIIKGWQNNANR